MNRILSQPPDFISNMDKIYVENIELRCSLNYNKESLIIIYRAVRIN